MSRIGKQPVKLPKGVQVNLSGQDMVVKGPKGELKRSILPQIKAHLDTSAGVITFTRESDLANVRAYHGLERKLVHNMVVGVSEGFTKELELIGVGYKADSSGNNLKLGLGYSHDIDFAVPQGVTASVVREGRQIFIKLEGIDKQLVGQTAATIKSLRKVEPYKGKGIRYKGEVIKLKAGKSGKK